MSFSNHSDVKHSRQKTDNFSQRPTSVTRVNKNRSTSKPSSWRARPPKSNIGVARVTDIKSIDSVSNIDTLPVGGPVPPIIPVPPNSAVAPERPPASAPLLTHSNQKFSGQQKPTSRQPDVPNRVEPEDARELLRPSFSLGSISPVEIQQDYPDSRFAFDAKLPTHSHPRLAIERVVGEALIYDRLFRQLNVRSILDIGGSPLRHKFYRRNSIWSCNPTLDSADVFRVLSYRKCQNYCAHDARSCTCRKFGAAMSIHSLYYLSPSDIFGIVDRTSGKCLYALIHTFDSPVGSFGQGEAYFKLMKDGTVRMATRGDTFTYVHSNMFWLNEPGPVIGGRRLIWQIFRRLKYSVIYQFTICDNVIPASVIEPWSLSSSILDERHYGTVSLRTKSFHSDKVNVPFVDGFVRLHTIHSVFGSLFVCADDKEFGVLVPKGLIHDVATYSLGLQRNQSSFSAVLDWTKKRVRNCEMFPESEASGILYAASIGFMMNLDMEYSILKTVVEPRLSAAGAVNRAYMFTFQRTWCWWHLALIAMCVLPLHFIGVFNSMLFLATVVLTTAPVVVYNFWFILLVVIFCVFFYHAPRPCLDLNDLVVRGIQRYRIDRRSFSIPVPAVVPVQSLILPTTTSTRPLNPIDVGAKITLPDMTTYDQERLELVGVAFPERIPVVASKNGTNEAIGCNNRGLITKLPFDEPQFVDFLGWRERNLKEIYPEEMENGRWPLKVDFEEWVSRYPAQRQLQLRAALKRVVDYGKFNPAWAGTKMFTKIELLLKSDPTDLEDFDPRMISGCSDEFAVITGPFMYQLQNWLKRCWNKKHFITYTAGMTGDLIGEWFSRCGHHNHFDYFSSDASKFDGYTNRAWITDKNAFYTDRFCYSGVDQLMISLFQDALGASINKFGYGYEGTKYSVTGTVASGHFDTGCGDTKINGELHLYSYCKANRITDLRPWLEQKIGSTRFIMAVCGDDNLSIATKGSWRGFDVAKQARSLGYVLKTNIYNDSYDCEYLSSLFWPARQVVDGQITELVVLGPKPMRLLPKIGWRVKSPNAPMSPAQHFKSNLLTVVNDCSHVPILNTYVTHCLEVLDGVEAKARNEMAYDRPHIAGSYDMHPDSLVLLQHRYGITREDLVDFCSFFTTHVKSAGIPSFMSYPRFKGMCEIDCPL
jgi:hypothetical protein